MQFSKNELISNRTFWYVFSIFLTVGYLLIGLQLLRQLPVNHDELVYIIKSWWLFSGQTDWYSDDTPLWYLPGAYFWPGLSQMIFGHGFHGARAIGFIAGLGTIYLVFLYVKNLSGIRAACFTQGALIASNGILGWPTASSYSISALLTIAVLITGSDQFVRSRIARVVFPCLFLTMLIFTRLNHLVLIFLLIPIIYVTNRESPLKDTILICATTLFTCLIVLFEMPSNFIQTTFSFGIADFIWEFIFQRDVVELLPELQPFYDSDLTQKSTSGSTGLTQLEGALISLSNNYQTLIYSHLFFFIAFFLNIIFYKKLRWNSISICFGAAFIVTLVISFLFGHTMCLTCPLRYLDYVIVVSAIFSGIIFSKLISLTKRQDVLSFFLGSSMLVVAIFCYQKNLNPQSPFNRTVIEQIRKTIDEKIPRREPVLIVGDIDGILKKAIYLSDRGFPSPLANEAFSFLPLKAGSKLPKGVPERISQKGYWTPDHLKQWISHDYNFLLKAKWLFYTDHKKVYWFRNIYYHPEVRGLIPEKFDCADIPLASNHVEFELCTRKLSQ